MNFFELAQVKTDISAILDKHKVALSLFHVSPEDFANQSIVKFNQLLKVEESVSEHSKSKISITTTVTCIKSILLIDDYTIYDFAKFIDELNCRFKNNDVTTSGLEHGNPFTIGLLLPLLNQLVDKTNLNDFENLRQFCIEKAKAHLLEPGISIPDFPKHAYLAYYNLVGLQGAGVHNLSQICHQTINWSQEELYKQISYFEANDEEEADVFQLGYNLLIQKAFNYSNTRESIIDLSLKIIFNSQLTRGVWEKRTPLFNYGKKGDAFPFSFELLNALFKEFEDQDSKLSRFDEYLNNSFNWVLKNVRYKEVTYRDKNYSVPIWKSVNRQNEVLAESWSTSEVFLFLHHYKTHILRRIQKAAREEFDGFEKRIANPNSFSNLSLPDINIASLGGEIRLDEFLISRVLEPLKSTSKGRYSISNNPNKLELARSGILFGPPGTGKTTYVKCIAKYLGWPLITINPSDFAKQGIMLMPPVTSEIFLKLLELEDSVIFFDEMEELIKKRESDTSFEQKFLTTTLLPKLQNLHDKANCLFLVATNFLGEIDVAAKREGRFDFKIQILPPSIESKKTELENRFGKLGLEEHTEIVMGKLLSKHDAFKYSTRKEFERLIIKLSKCDFANSSLSSIFNEFENSISLKDKISDLKNFDSQNSLDL